MQEIDQGVALRLLEAALIVLLVIQIQVGLDLREFQT
jgi:hypothetical protein